MKKKIVIILLLISSICFAHEWDEDSFNNKKNFQEGVIRAIGVSAPGQEEYKALTAAQIIAQTNLIAKIKGASISSRKIRRNGVIIQDEIYRTIHGLIVGAEPCGEKYYQDKGYAKYCVQISLNGRKGVYDAVFPAIKDYLPKGEFFKSDTTFNSKMAENYDGLIIDVKNFSSFQPAIANRILNEYWRVIYEPSMVFQKILIEKGPVQFATSNGKAKAILSNIGSKNPLYVKAKKINNHTDIVVCDDDADKIYKSNSKSNMLNNARVVFILN